MIILHPSESMGESFKLLSCMVDVNLRMQSAVERVLSTIWPKVTAILRARGHYTTRELILQFKTHVRGFTETNMDGYSHAAPSSLDKIDE